ncbi:MAG: hypothetical protein LBH95_05950 [Oscillospiraceae bacterium]|jgi:hypothetical protein|nr:hypothetical protein [Oscillospiraceae bacterium]
MKKTICIFLALILTLAFAACDGNGGGIRYTTTPSDNSGGGSNSGNDSDGGSEGKIDLNDAADKLIKEAEEQNAFSMAAAFAAMKERGVEKADVEPVWDYTVDEDNYQAYGDSGAYGHGVIRFTKKNGEVSDEEYEAWARKLYDATAKISDDGNNINGYDNLFSDADPLSEISFDDAFGKNSTAIIVMQGWGYKYNGTFMRVSIERKEAPGFDSEYLQDDGGNWYFTHNYTAVEADVATGLQKSFDDAWADMEDAFEEHEDEIKKALEDYMG